MLPREREGAERRMQIAPQPKKRGDFTSVGAGSGGSFPERGERGSPRRLLPVRAGGKGGAGFRNGGKGRSLGLFEEKGEKGSFWQQENVTQREKERARRKAHLHVGRGGGRKK